jgi:hypothetical protein
LVAKAASQDEILFGIWFSNSKAFSKKAIRLYISLTNQSGFDVTGTIEVYDNGVLVGRQDVLMVNGRFTDWWINQPDRVFTYGDHIFDIRLVKSFIWEVGKPPREIVFKNSSFTQKKFMDRDTDGDELGDLEDPDDDNDNVSDEEELALGLDPKSKNSDSEIKSAREKLSNKNKANPVDDNSNPLDKVVSKLPQSIADPVKKTVNLITDIPDRVVARLPQYILDPLKESDRLVSNLVDKITKKISEKRQDLLKGKKEGDKEIAGNKINEKDGTKPKQVDLESGFWPQDGRRHVSHPPPAGVALYVWGVMREAGPGDRGSLRLIAPGIVGGCGVPVHRGRSYPFPSG